MASRAMCSPALRITDDQVHSTQAALTRPDGLHLHFVDLRDHFLKYPFEVLCYSEGVWKR
jgi:hypothetical protein